MIFISVVVVVCSVSLFLLLQASSENVLADGETAGIDEEQEDEEEEENIDVQSEDGEEEDGEGKSFHIIIQERRP